MKRAIVFHSNAVWPPSLWVAIFVVLCVVFDGGILLLETAAPAHRAFEISSTPEIVNVRTVLIAGAAGVFAMFRLVRFHPACNDRYRNWLEQTPWTADKPLPGGPAHIVWQDMAVIGALTLFAGLHPKVNPIWPALVFALVYLVAMTLLLAATRQRTHFLILGFLWPALFLPAMRGWPQGVLSLALLGIIWHGHRATLRAFPWEFPGGGSIWQIPAPALGVEKVQRIGWPYKELSVKVGFKPTSLTTCFFISILFGWWTFCIMAAGGIPSVSGAILVLAIVVATGRLLLYLSPVGPSFNVWGRLAAKQFVVPGFDVVFLSPAAAILLAVLAEIVVRSMGFVGAVADSIVVALIWFVLLSGGPTFRAWLLTGHHRLRQPVTKRRDRGRLRSI